MAHDFRAVRELFERALDVAPAARDAWLREAANDDGELAAEVERLLELDAAAAPAIDAPPSVPTLLADPGAQWLGREIGSFRLMAVLGRGGMGTVFEAEQQRPHRRVALKVMRHSIGGDKARARFEYEAEILARLQHPGIAQVYEAATFEVDGVPQPYFAMELIDGGRPLDDYVRERGLDCEAVLRLVELICDAVHHGHQRGVVHRDLKPQNVLVDAVGQPKLIDFGIARAGGTGWQATLSSESNDVVGTLAYMAPEQLDQGGAAIDTRVDVYALGVILFQLLAGRLPLELAELPLGRATDVIRNQEPPRLSLAADGRELPPDLDWILARALAKDPDRRYASAQALREELERLRRGEPVLAGPPSAAYRLRKFVRRNAIAVFAGAAIVLALIGGTIATSIGWQRAVAAETLAEARRKEAERNSMEMWQVANMQFELLGSARGDRNIKLADVVHDWSTRLPQALVSDRVAATMHAALGSSFYGLGLNDKALAEYDLALARIGDRGTEMPRARRLVLAGKARVLNGIGKDDEAEPLLRQAIAELEASDDDGSYELATMRATLGSVLLETREFAEALQNYERAVPVVEAVAGANHPSAIRGRLGIALCLEKLEDFDAARAAFVDVVERAGAHLGPEDPDTLSAKNTFAVFLFHRGDIDGALAQFESLHEASVRIAGPAHPNTVRYASNQALCHERRKRFAAAEAIYREILAARAASGAEVELTDLITRFNLVVALHNQDAEAKREEALELTDVLLADAARLLPADNWRRAVFQQHRGIVLRKLGRYDEAERELVAARAVLEKTLGPTHDRTRSNSEEMVTLYEAWGRPESAAAWRARL
ncbi:MAG: serine/threonine protein kinase [Planctomycetes bacterium]|nr:serine/threonine protein kinase [Planctomycetota bacterium]